MTAETVEVPVTRTARVALIGRVYSYGPQGGFALDHIADPSTVVGPLCKLVARPVDRVGYPFRSGIATVHRVEGERVFADFGAIVAFAPGDYVYLVEEP